ncbi:DNA repair protein RecO [Candidatus Roizmanbacteria bacterium RIFCSPHIGHO2_12_FULL_41_11]|uniref:DNA repair protein RecO n=3 Tax=Candidatus Roizmaniibacteriota TaxID=1752723 RepID=A0A1F7JRL2_9BACT|nr:MAG: DNA repair protein RecO [Candidatus Roizmanbacteria bacterium RIFCSPHIGHO2_12_FULL_41_11]OGK51360.1 MAG: DNA repair protein RecO [Candidatus Roizmanbacteria bacterium RIFCSPLOWO2_01_FULL_41_22]OGK58264.1 MAG: DNA repair protein RecO [Candidatus Roizmanbacteria bacterium RIFCSPLOWO2_02_FULL_41_9]
MSATIKTEALILKKNALLRKDVLVTLFTQEKGKLRVVAKGLKTLTSRRSPHVQTGNLLEVIVSSGSRGYYLQTTNLISGFGLLKKEPFKLEYLYTYFFMLDRLLPEEQPEPVVYIQTKQLLIDLSKSHRPHSFDFEQYVFMLLLRLGYIHEKKPLNQLMRMVEEIIQEKIPTDVIM